MKIELPAGASVEARDGKLTLQLPSKRALAELQRDTAGKLADLLSSAAERLREEPEKEEKDRATEKKARRKKRRVLRHHQVAEIKREIEDRGSNWSEKKVRAWAKKFDVSAGSVRRVLKGETFEDVEPAPANQVK